MGAVVDAFDVIVIGSGPAGLASCFAALKANKKVLIIDAGETLRQQYASTQFDERYQGRATGGLGGAARLWGAQSGFLDTKSLQVWCELSGFTKESLASLDEARGQMNEFLQINVQPDNLYEVAKEVKLRNVALKYGFNLRHTTYPKNGNLELHWHRLINNSNVRVDLNRRLIKINAQDPNNIELIFESGESLNIGSTKLVIAAGTLSTTEIILRSFPEQSQCHRIGLKLQDHPCGVVASYTGNGNKQFVKGQILNSKYGILKRKFEYRSSSASGVVELQYDLNSDTPSLKDISYLILNKLSQHFFKCLVLMPPKLNVWVQIEQSPENSLVINPTTDQLVSLWSCDKNDMDTFKEIYEATHHMLVSEGFTLVKKPDFSQFYPNQAFHPSGTIPMHNNPDLGFVNETGIIHEYPQVQIASAAIFPTSSWVNPTFLIMVLSYLGTRHLLG